MSRIEVMTEESDLIFLFRFYTLLKCIKSIEALVVLAHQVLKSQK